MLVDYQEGADLISLHHTCMIYKVSKYDESSLKDDILEEDVSGCAWIEKAKLDQLPLSKVVL
jgi:hypothetical protein